MCSSTQHIVQGTPQSHLNAHLDIHVHASMYNSITPHCTPRHTRTRLNAHLNHTSLHTSTYTYTPQCTPQSHLVAHLDIHVHTSMYTSLQLGWPFSSHDQISCLFPDISSEYLRRIDPCNSSDTQQNACYFSLQYSEYILSQLRQLCSICKTLPSKELLSCIFHVKNNARGNWPHTHTHLNQ